MTQCQRPLKMTRQNYKSSGVWRTTDLQRRMYSEQPVISNCLFIATFGETDASKCVGKKEKDIKKYIYEFRSPSTPPQKKGKKLWRCTLLYNLRFMLRNKCDGF